MAITGDTDIGDLRSLHNLFAPGMRIGSLDSNSRDGLAGEGGLIVGGSVATCRCSIIVVNRRLSLIGPNPIETSKSGAKLLITFSISLMVGTFGHERQNMVFHLDPSDKNL